jgi:hypothetical protein
MKTYRHQLAVSEKHLVDIIMALILKNSSMVGYLGRP